MHHMFRRLPCGRREHWPPVFVEYPRDVQALHRIAQIAAGALAQNTM